MRNNILRIGLACALMLAGAAISNAQTVRFAFNRFAMVGMLRIFGIDGQPIPGVRIILVGDDQNPDTCTKMFQLDNGSFLAAVEMNRPCFTYPQVAVD